MSSGLWRGELRGHIFNLAPSREDKLEVGKTTRSAPVMYILYVPEGSKTASATRTLGIKYVSLWETFLIQTTT